jgi:hypothetical protein
MGIEERVVDLLVENRLDHDGGLLLVSQLGLDPLGLSNGERVVEPNLDPPVLLGESDYPWRSSAAMR